MQVVEQRAQFGVVLAMDKGFDEGAAAIAHFLAMDEVRHQMLAAQEFLDVLQGFLGVFGFEPVTLERLVGMNGFDHRAGKGKTGPHGPGA
jgi:hypothetical protein